MVFRIRESQVGHGRGEGECLASYATLLRVPPSQYIEVCKLAQEVYGSVWRPGISTEESIK